jgi:hypothetical protein
LLRSSTLGNGSARQEPCQIAWKLQSLLSRWTSGPGSGQQEDLRPGIAARMRGARPRIERFCQGMPWEYDSRCILWNQPLTRYFSLRQCLLLSALACILRPTNVLIWATLASIAWFRNSWDKRIILIREVLICGYGIPLPLRGLICPSCGSQGALRHNM